MRTALGTRADILKLCSHILSNRFADTLCRGDDHIFKFCLSEHDSGTGDPHAHLREQIHNPRIGHLPVHQPQQKGLNILPDLLKQAARILHRLSGAGHGAVHTSELRHVHLFLGRYL